MNGYEWSNGERNRNYEQEKRAGYNSTANSDEQIKRYTEQIRIYEDKINTLESEKQSFVARIQENEQRVLGLMKDNNLLSDHLREISEKENKLYDTSRAKETLELQKQSLQDTVRRNEIKLKENENIIKSLSEELDKQNQEFQFEKSEYETALEVVRRKLADFERLLGEVENENEKLRIQITNQTNVLLISYDN